MSASITQCVVLLADDDVLVRNLVRRSLEAAGFVVLAAANGTEALALSKASSEPIHILVTDVNMPGMDGVTLAKQIRRERTDTLILLMSGGTTLSIPNGMPFIAKPFSPTDLLAKVKELLRTGSTDAAIT
jgi:DNA-binding response OmpR family regulator